MTFEKYIQYTHAEDYAGTDDDMPEAYEEWLSDLDMDTLILYANDYGEIKKLEGFDMASNIIKNL